MSLVSLISSDGKSFQIEAKIAKLSRTISRLMEDFTSVAPDDFFIDNPIPLPKVTAEVLEKIVDWGGHKIGERARNEDYEERKLEWSSLDERQQEQLEKQCMEEKHNDISSWSKQFFEISNQHLFDLIMASNYLDIRELLELSCKAVADLMKGKTSEEIRMALRIENDLRPDEERKIQQENAWIDKMHELTTSPELQSGSHSFVEEPDISEPFPLLDLPNEIIPIILQRMVAMDRLQARVNQRLYNLEASDQNWLDEVMIANGITRSDASANPRKLRLAVNSTFPCSIYFAVLTKFADITIGRLVYTLTEPRCPLTPYVKAIPARELIVTFEQQDTSITDATIDEWSHGRESLQIAGLSHGVTGAALVKVYNDTVNHRGTLVRLRSNCKREAALFALSEIGIFFKNDVFHTTRDDMKVFVKSSGSLEHSYFIILGQNLLIIVKKTTLTGLDLQGRAPPSWTAEILDRSGEMIVERQNEDGSLPPNQCFAASHSIQSIIADSESPMRVFRPVNVVYCVRYNADLMRPMQ